MENASWASAWAARAVRTTHPASSEEHALVPEGRLAYSRLALEAQRVRAGRHIVDERLEHPDLGASADERGLHGTLSQTAGRPTATVDATVDALVTSDPRVRRAAGQVVQLRSWKRSGEPSGFLMVPLGTYRTSSGTAVF